MGTLGSMTLTGSATSVYCYSLGWFEEISIPFAACVVLAFVTSVLIDVLPVAAGLTLNRMRLARKLEEVDMAWLEDVAVEIEAAEVKELEEKKSQQKPEQSTPKPKTSTKQHKPPAQPPSTPSETVLRRPRPLSVARSVSNFRLEFKRTVSDHTLLAAHH